ncbi:MAG TPA: GNAT family protein [Rhizomicrobium sp.]|nr:GNAT family protein [Rhizomicrobium sp.]
MAAALDLARIPAPLPQILGGVSPSDGVVSIGPIQQRDLENLFVWLNDARAATLDLPYRPLDCLAFRDWLDRLPRETSQILFAIRESCRPDMIGFVLFKNFQPVYQTAELGVRIGAEGDRGKGYGTRAVKLALDYAWNVLNLHRVSLQVLATNERAIVSYLRAGFVMEGRLREAAFIDGQWRDMAVMGALKPAQKA